MKEDIRIVAFCRSFKPARLKNIFEQTDRIRTMYTHLIVHPRQKQLVLRTSGKTSQTEGV
jgi:hypothetical protein